MIKLFSGEDSLLILHRFHQSARQKQTKTQFHFIACKTSRNPNTEKKNHQKFITCGTDGSQKPFLV